MAASWQSLLPREMEKSAMDSVVVQREEGEGYNSYQQFVGSGRGVASTRLAWRFVAQIQCWPWLCKGQARHHRGPAKPSLSLGVLPGRQSFSTRQ